MTPPILITVGNSFQSTINGQRSAMARRGKLAETAEVVATVADKGPSVITDGPLVAAGGNVISEYLINCCAIRSMFNFHSVFRHLWAGAGHQYYLISGAAFH
jgi:hypothetical protein